MWRTLVLCGLVFVSCSNPEEKKEKTAVEKSQEAELLDYFYPVHEMTAPETIMYRSTINPLDEKYTHIIPMNESNDTAFIIEKFNRNLKLTEAFQLIQKENFIGVKKQRVASPKGVYDAKLIKTQFFPLTKEKSANFISHFPENDSILMVWDQLTSFDHIEEEFEHKGQKYNVAVFKKVINLYRLDEKNDLEQKVNELHVLEYWAKGIGLIKIHPENNSEQSIDYFKTLNQKEWSGLFNL